MAFLDELLGQGEHVLFVGRQHPYVLVLNVLTELMLIVLLVAAGVASGVAFPNSVVLGQPVGQLVMMVCIVISVAVFISALFDYLRWSHEQFIVTDQRVIHTRGIFSRESLDSSLEKINDIQLRQSWWGRVWGFGDVEIITGSDTGVNLFHRIDDPLAFKRAMVNAQQEFHRGSQYLDQQSVAAYTQPAARHAAQPVTRYAVDVEDEGDNGDLPPETDKTEALLKTLADLRDLGLLSDEEYQLKRRDVLARRGQ